MLVLCGSCCANCVSSQNKLETSPVSTSSGCYPASTVQLSEPADRAASSAFQIRTATVWHRARVLSHNASRHPSFIANCEGFAEDLTRTTGRPASVFAQPHEEKSTGCSVADLPPWRWRKVSWQRTERISSTTGLPPRAAAPAKAVHTLPIPHVRLRKLVACVQQRTID